MAKSGGRGGGDLNYVKFVLSVMKDDLQAMCLKFSERGEGSESVCSQGQQLISHIENHESTALITEDERLNIDENRSILLTQIEGFKRIAEKYEYLAPFLLTRFGNCSVQLKDIWQPDNADDEVVVTGGGDADKWKFFKATPVKNPPEKIQCGEEDCTKTFINPKGLQRHVKKIHEKHVDIGPLIPKTTCRLEHSKYSKTGNRYGMDTISRHLFEVHKIPKPVEGSLFRGFLTTDGGVTFQPVFLKEGEEDPQPPESMHAANEDIEMSGASTIKECDVPSENGRKKDESKDVEKDGSKEDEKNNVEEEKEKAEAGCSGSGMVLVEDQGVDNNDYQDDMEAIFGSENLEEKRQLDNDPDLEDEDDKAYREEFTQNRKERYRKRSDHVNVDDTSLLPENQTFIEGFEHFMRFKSAAENTIRAAKALLFEHEDSFLKFESRKDPTFRLSQLIDFKNENNFRELAFPSEWIDDIAGETGKENALRRRQMYKTHKNLREYLLKKIRDTKFGAKTSDLLRRDKIKEHVNQMTHDINDTGVWAKLSTMIDVQAREVANAKAVFQPHENINETVAVEEYFKSEQFKSKAEKFDALVVQVETTGKCSAKNYNDLGNFVRHVLAFEDRNRRSAYQFSNGDFLLKRYFWLPENHNQEGYEGLEGLNGVDIYEKPGNRDPDGFIIKLTGSQDKLKLKEEVNITVQRRSAEWMRKYRQVKGIIFGTLAPEKPFFSTFVGKPFSPISNTRGSMLEEFSKITKLQNATTNSLRRGLETKIQNEPTLGKRSKAVIQHSEATGKKYYHRTGGEARISAMHYITSKEQESGARDEDNKESSSETDDEIASKRTKFEEEDEKASEILARKILEKNASKKKRMKIGKNCKLDPDNRLFLQKLFSSDGDCSSLKLYDGKFPGVKQWKKIFYRVVDGPSHLDNETRGKLLEIEAAIFHGVAKEKLEKETNAPWTGKIEEHFKADVLIANTIFNSFKYYEKNLKGFKTSFFKFN